MATILGCPPQTCQSLLGQSRASRERSSGLQEWQVLDGDLPLPARLANDRFVPGAVSGSLPDTAPKASDLRVFCKGKRVLHVDPEIAHRILDLAVTKKNLDGTKVASGPVDDRCLRSAK